ncbi:MAG: DUF4276 family protein [Paludibacter sp.]
MKRLIIIVEGQTEEEFVNQVLAPYFITKGILSVVPIKIATSSTSKGGFVNYQHLKNDVLKRIRESDIIISTFVDYFRMPTSIPNYAVCQHPGNVDDRIACLEKAIATDINFPNFIPYIQKHEFEALLFSSSKGFESLYAEDVISETASVIAEYQNPEDINSRPEFAPSKRLISIMGSYEKVFEGNMIALEVGINTMLEKCPRFRNWVEKLITEVSE